MKTEVPRSRIIEPADAPRFELGALRVQALAAPSRGSLETSVWRLEIAARSQGVPHSVTREEIFYALEGEASVTIDGDTRHLKSGCALVVPAHIEFSIANPRDEPFVAIAVLPVGGQAMTSIGEPFTPPWAA